MLVWWKLKKEGATFGKVLTPKHISKEAQDFYDQGAVDEPKTDFTSVEPVKILRNTITLCVFRHPILAGYSQRPEFKKNRKGIVSPHNQDK